jgi:predicted solute-binding protein
MEHGRRILPVSEAKKLKLAVDAKLTDAELLALILYTGPMFQVCEKRARICACVCVAHVSAYVGSHDEHASFQALTCVAGLQLRIAPIPR